MAGLLSRRQFLFTSILAAAHAGLVPRVAGASQTTGSYRVDVGVLYGLLSLSLTGSVVEEIDATAARYRVTLEGQGSGATHRTDSAGVIREGRFVPEETRTHQVLRGRESKMVTTYDHARGAIEYHAVGHTLILGRRRQVDDVIRTRPGQAVDDLVTANLNFAADKLDRDPDGSYRTAIVRRAWKDNEGPDDVSPAGYRAEIVPVRFNVAPDPATGRFSGHLDMTALSSWARAGEPARLTFDPTRHLESLRTTLILGTTITVRFSSGA